MKTVVNFGDGSTVNVPLTPAEIAARDAEEAAWAIEAPRQARLSEITARLAQIDIDAIRPLRAVAAGTASSYDTDKLAALETEAAALRAERAALIS
jgi:hypothetical protein